MYAVVEVDKVGCECTIKGGTYNSVGWMADQELLELHNKVDLVITLGGDGTLIWVAFCLLLLWHLGSLDRKNLGMVWDGFWHG
jgi:hypothetical protein